MIDGLAVSNHKKYSIGAEAYALMSFTDINTLSQPLVVELQTDDGKNITIFIDLKDIKEHLSTYGDQRPQTLAEIKDYIKSYVVKCLSWISSSIPSFNFKSIEVYKGKIMPHCKIKFFLCGLPVMNFWIYVSYEFVEVVQYFLSELDNEFVRNNYLLFNTKLYFPLIVGKSVISSDDLYQLKVGDVIIFDEKTNVNELEVLWTGTKNIVKIPDQIEP